MLSAGSSPSTTPCCEKKQTLGIPLLCVREYYFLVSACHTARAHTLQTSPRLDTHVEPMVGPQVEPAPAHSTRLHSSRRGRHSLRQHSRPASDVRCSPARCRRTQPPAHTHTTRHADWLGCQISGTIAAVPLFAPPPLLGGGCGGGLSTLGRSAAGASATAPKASARGCISGGGGGPMWA